MYTVNEGIGRLTQAIFYTVRDTGMNLIALHNGKVDLRSPVHVPVIIVIGTAVPDTRRMASTEESTSARLLKLLKRFDQIGDEINVRISR